jgi:hypothetical protein
MLRRWRSDCASLALDLTRADALVFGTADGSPRNPITVSQMFSAGSRTRARHSGPTRCR